MQKPGTELIQSVVPQKKKKKMMIMMRDSERPMVVETMVDSAAVIDSVVITAVTMVVSLTRDLVLLESCGGSLIKIVTLVTDSKDIFLAMGDSWAKSEMAVVVAALLLGEVLLLGNIGSDSMNVSWLLTVALDFFTVDSDEKR